MRHPRWRLTWKMHGLKPPRMVGAFDIILPPVIPGFDRPTEIHELTVYPGNPPEVRLNGVIPCKVEFVATGDFMFGEPLLAVAERMAKNDET